MVFAARTNNFAAISDQERRGRRRTEVNQRKATESSIVRAEVNQRKATLSIALADQ